MIETVVSRLATPLDPLPTDIAPVLPNLSGVNAVLFDVYGTLLISGSGDVGVATESSKPQALVEATNSCGIPFDGDPQQGLDDLHSQIATEHESLKASGVDFPEVRIPEIWLRTLEQWSKQRLVQEVPDPEVIEQLTIEYEMRVNPVWPMPGLVETLDRLRASGVALGIVSNAQAFTPRLFEPLTNRTLESFGFVPELCFWSYEHRVAKPGTQLYEEAAEVLEACSMSAETTLYVGNDMRNDIWPASQVGFQTALFAGDSRSLRLREDDSEIANVRPTATVTHLSQILDLLKLPQSAGVADE